MKAITELFAKTSNLVARAFGSPSSPGNLGQGTYTVIDWTAATVSGQEMSVVRGRVAVRRQFHARWPNDASPENAPQRAGQWLKQQLRQAGISTVNTIVCVPRHVVSLRLLEFPMVEDQELDSLVMLQLESRAELLPDDRVFDYLPLPSAAGAAKRHVLLATIPTGICQQIAQTVEEAGLTLKASGIGELAIDVLTDVQTSGLTLNVLANHSKVEFVLSQAGAPLASHATRIPKVRHPEFAASILNVADRMIAALPESLSQGKLKHINLMGPNADLLYGVVEQRSNCVVNRVSTRCDESIRALALMTCLSQSNETVNFTSPRRPADPRVARRRQVLRTTVAASLLAALVGYWTYDEQSQLRRRAATLAEAESRLETLNQRGESTIEAWQFINDWQSSAVDWSDELQAFSAQLPESGKGYLTRIQLEQNSQTRLPVIRADGLAKTPDIAMAVNRKLMAVAGKYELQNHGIEPAPRDTDFRSAFRLEAAIRNTQPAPDSSAERPTPSDPQH